MQTIKCGLVGDRVAGKTSLAYSYCYNFPLDYTSFVFENYNRTLLVDGKPIDLRIWDTAGQEDYARLPPLSYPNTDVLLMCFSLVDQTSLENVKVKWHPEVIECCPKVPIILVGTQLELCEDEATVKKLKQERSRPITYKEGLAVAKKIDAVTYLECSAFKEASVERVFENAVKLGVLYHNNDQKIEEKMKKSRKCEIL